MDWILIVNSCLLGIALAMDAFSVSIANGVSHPKIFLSKKILIAVCFGILQGLMPLLGWLFVHSLSNKFVFFQNITNWIGFFLLLYIGIQMIRENNEEESISDLAITTILVQGIATSIDALSVGFTIANYTLSSAILCASIIAVITFIICFMGIYIGIFFGNKYTKNATKFGGIILILIGIEILLKGFFG